MRAILRLPGKDESLIRYVPDRPGHDRRYAIDCAQDPRASWAGARDTRSRTGLGETVAWYRANGAWAERVRTGAYLDYYEKQYAGRLARRDDG